jgi:glycine/D-amino acid oxidase-like deaminating enzyme
VTGAEADAVVVGAGVIGLLAAVSCAGAGASVVVLDQGPIPSPEATSFDEHRIVRAFHPGDVEATRRAARGERRWVELEARLGQRLYHRIGALTVLDVGDTAGARATLAGAGVRAEVLDRHELVARWPHLRFPPEAVGVLERDAGVVLASRALGAIARWLSARPNVELRARHEVTAVDPDAGLVHLAGRRPVRARRILVAAGPWSRALVGPRVAARLALFRQTVLYCRVPPGLAAPWARTPAVPTLSPADGSWLAPPVAGTRLKLSAGSACRRVSELGERRTPAQWREHVVEAFAGRLEGFDRTWVADARDCYYLADAATGGAVATRLAHGSTAWAYAACGGTSFKLAPLVASSLAARVLADMRRRHAGKTGRVLLGTIDSCGDASSD